MTRGDFLALFAGLPFLGWVTKLDKAGRPIRVVEPVSVPYISDTGDRLTAWTAAGNTSTASHTVWVDMQSDTAQWSHT